MSRPKPHRHAPDCFISVTGTPRPESEIDVDTMVAIVMEMGRQLKAEYDEKVGLDDPEAMDLWLDKKRESWSLSSLPSDAPSPEQSLDATEADPKPLSDDQL